MKVYDIPEGERETVISRVLEMDLAAIAHRLVEKTIQLAHDGFDTDTLLASAAETQEVDAR